jgi:hypothetical protein
MRTGILALSALLILQSKDAQAQQVVIRSAEPAAVVQELRTLLEAQGFSLASSNPKEAVFTRAGIVGNPATFFDQVIHELRFRFKQKGDRLTVTASEESVTKRNGIVQSRLPIDHRVQLEELLAAVQAQLESIQPATDSARKRDSTD